MGVVATPDESGTALPSVRTFSGSKDAEVTGSELGEAHAVRNAAAASTLGGSDGSAAGLFPEAWGVVAEGFVVKYP